MLFSGTAQSTHAQDIPVPIDPNNAEQTLLDLVNSLPINDVQQALDHYPVPYVVIAQAGSANPTVVNQNAGSPVRVDADQSKTTGQGGGGDDLIVEVNTELLPSPHLVLTIERLGSAPFASNLEVVVAFPFDAFNTEDLTGSDSPNLFFGYKTVAAFAGSSYPPGGHAPEMVTYDIVPHVLAGADHQLELQIDTTGADNPIQFLAGHFDGTANSGVLNALGVSALADPVPTSMSFGLEMDQSLFASPATATDSSFSIDYNASASTKMTFSYFENEDFPISGTPDFGTSLTFDQMPTSEQLSIAADFAARTLTLSHESNAPIGEITLEHKRRDGLDVTGTAKEVPTSVDVTLDFAGALTVDVGGTGFGSASPNTMDIDVVATQTGGFPNTSGFFGYPIGYAQLTLEDVPDMSAAYDATTDSFSVQATNSGESIGSAALVIGDDDDLELPSRWSDPSWHDFSLIDDGTHGTAAARIIDLEEATLKLDGSPLGETYDFMLGSRSPMQLYLETAETSALTGKDVLAACEVQDMPEGLVHFEIDFPNQFAFNADPTGQVINSITCAGHIGTLNFELAAGHIPEGSGYDFDPNGKLQVTVEPGGVANSDFIGFISARLWDETNPLPFTLVPGNLFGALHDARLRADHIPSFLGTWSDGAATNINFDTGIPDAALFLGGVQLSVSSVVELTTPLDEATGTSHHYARFTDLGAGNPIRMAAGVFGIDEFSYQSSDAAGNMAFHYVADSARVLDGEVDSRFGGVFFPAYDIDATLKVDAVPQSFDLTTNLRTEVHYTGSDGISEVSVTGDIDNSGPSTADKTHVVFLAQGLPDAVDFVLTPASGATLSMSSQIDLISLELTSDVDIFGSGFRHIMGSIADIPAGWTAAWGASPNPHASLSTTTPLGAVQIIVSTDLKANTPGKYTPFETDGGAVQYTAFAREIDNRYYTAGPPDATTRSGVFMDRLDGLYGTTSKLDPNEDHVILRPGFTSVRGTGFQCVSAQVGPGSFECVASGVAASEVAASILLPVAGVHPFYVGMEQSSDTFLTVQVPDVPDSTSALAGPTRFNLDFSDSPGDILIYRGPLPGASDGQNALKVQLINTPSFVHASWDFGFPGGINIDTSNPMEVRFLTQDNGSRIAGAFRVQGLGASWGTVSLSPHPECSILPPGCNVNIIVIGVKVELHATGVPIDGFLTQYDFIGSPKALSPAGPAAAANEYVPRNSFLLDNFQSLEMSAGIEVCVFQFGLLPCAFGVPLPFVDISVNVGGAVFDWWDLGGDPLADEDYIDNNPWHFYPWNPLLHSFADHVLPFVP